MAKKELTGEYAYSNFGETFNKTKLQKTCETQYYSQKESSEKSVFQQLQLLLEQSSGQVFHRRQQKQTHAFPEHPNGLNVSKVKTRKLSLRLLLSRTFATLSKGYSYMASVVSNLSGNIQHTRLKIAGFLYSMWANKRLRWGLLLLLIAAPAAKLFYMLFPEFGFGEYLVNNSVAVVPNFIETQDLGNTEGWFYQTLWFYFWQLGEILSPLIAIFGIFLLFPKKYYPSYLVGIPFGYFMSLLIHRMFVTSNDEYHEGFGVAVIAMWIILGVVIFIISDKLLFKENHVKRAAEARIVGLINMPGMDWKDKETMLKKEARDWSQNENELFTKTG